MELNLGKEDLEKNNSNQKSNDKIFSDFLGSVIEDCLVLMHKFSLKELMERLERTIIISILTKFEGNQRKTANFLRLNPTTLNEKMKRYNISSRTIPDKD